MVFDAINYEEVRGTWAYELKKHWDAFNQVCDHINLDGKIDKYKFREYVLWDMKRRHEEENGRVTEGQECAEKD